MTAFLPDFGSLALTVGSFILALMVIVAIHEYGHYIVGRWCGIGAKVFSLGFGPVLAKRTDRRGMQWQIAALPFGGYVKFLGDANAASVGGEAPEGIDPRTTMAGAPLWARALTVAAGPVANFLLTILIFAGLLIWNGKTADTLAVGELRALPPQLQTPLQTGDEILRINGAEAATGAEYVAALDTLEPTQRDVEYVLRRAGEEMTFIGAHPQPPLASSITPRSAAYAAEMRPGDVIVAIDGTPVHSFGMVQQAVKDGQGASMELTLWREGAERSVTLTPRRTDLPAAGGGFETRWLIGLTGGLVFDPQTQPVGVLEAIKGGLDRLGYIISSSLSGLWHMITGAISSCNLSSPVGIAQTSGAMASQGAGSFIAFVAFLSAAIGLMNLFPIPVLDGGHLVFYAIEAVTGKPPSAGVLNIAVAVGLSLLLAVMGLALMNDMFLCAQ